MKFQHVSRTIVVINGSFERTPKIKIGLLRYEHLIYAACVQIGAVDCFGPGYRQMLWSN